VAIELGDSGTEGVESIAKTEFVEMERLPLLDPVGLVFFKRAQRFDNLGYVNRLLGWLFARADLSDISQKENACAHEKRGYRVQLVRTDSQHPAIGENRPE